MRSELLDEVNNYFTEPFKHGVALSLDEDSAAISKALSGIVPAGIEAAIQRSDKIVDEVSLQQLALGAATYFPAKPDLAVVNKEEPGTRLATSLLGDHEATLRYGIAKFAGIKNESAESLILTAMPVLMRAVGVYANNNKLDSNGIKDFLLAEKEQIKEVIPEGFVSVIKDIENGAVSAGKEAIEKITTDSVQKKNRAWILPLVLVIITLLIMIYLSRK